MVFFLNPFAKFHLPFRRGNFYSNYYARIYNIIHNYYFNGRRRWQWSLYIHPPQKLTYFTLVVYFRLGCLDRYSMAVKFGDKLALLFFKEPALKWKKKLAVGQTFLTGHQKVFEQNIFALKKRIGFSLIFAPFDWKKNRMAPLISGEYIILTWVLCVILQLLNFEGCTLHPPPAISLKYQYQSSLSSPHGRPSFGPPDLHLRCSTLRRRDRFLVMILLLLLLRLLLVARVLRILCFGERTTTAATWGERPRTLYTHSRSVVLSPGRRRRRSLPVGLGCSPESRPSTMAPAGWHEQKTPATRFLTYENARCKAVRPSICVVVKKLPAPYPSVRPSILRSPLSISDRHGPDSAVDVDIVVASSLILNTI